MFLTRFSILATFWGSVLGRGLCPGWVADISKDWLAQNPDDPGVQVYFSSRKSNLYCKASFQSNAINYTQEPPLLHDSPWRIASVTKPFTATAVLQLASKKQIDLFAPVEKYLPGWATSLLVQEQGADNVSQITTWMLLHHTSGLDDHANDQRWLTQVFTNPTYKWTQQTILEWAATYLSPLSAPGAEFHYSDTGYTYLGLVLENVTGLDLAAAVRKLDRLDELDMPSTYWEVYEQPPSGVLPRAGQYSGPIDITHFDPSSDLYGGGGLVSNAEDLSNFAWAVHNGKVLDRDSMDLLYSTVPAPGFETHLSYGCGWISLTIAGHQAWEHSGHWGGWMYWIQSLDLVISGTLNQNKNSVLPLVTKFVTAIVNQTDYSSFLKQAPMQNPNLPFFNMN